MRAHRGPCQDVCQRRYVESIRVADGDPSQAKSSSGWARCQKRYMLRITFPDVDPPWVEKAG